MTHFKPSLTEQWRDQMTAYIWLWNNDPELCGELLKAKLSDPLWRHRHGYRP